jgi:hypothetical protein
MPSLVAIVGTAILAVASAVGAGPSAEADADRLTPEQAEALVREVSAEVEKLRRLKFKTPVKIEIIDGTTARQQFESELDDETRQEARHTQDAWVHLGLIPETTDLVAGHLDLVEEEVLGYYEIGSDTFHLLSHVSAREVRSVMAHELTHALEDQHYDLEALQKSATNEDHAVAIKAVIEGSAMVTTLSILNREGGIAEARKEATRVGAARAKSVQHAPTFVRRRLLLPYTLGFTFLLRGKPWEWLFDGVRIADVEKAYAQPPHSTRQILHPEQYWIGQREGAPPLSLPDLSEVLGPGWSRAITGSIGELGLAMLSGSRLNTESFEILLPSRWTTTGAAGTAADLYDHYVNGDQKMTVLLTRWESVRDADQFQRTLRGADMKLFRLGVNLLVLMGDYGDKGDALAIRAVQDLKYWAGE